MDKKKILIIGEVFIDTYLDILTERGPLSRLGGIFHTARACAAANIDYALAYYAPDYLDKDINFYSLKLNSKGCFKLGSIDRTPNVMLINESKEIGSQGYHNIIKDQALFIDRDNIIDIINNINPTDILIYPGRYNVNKFFYDFKNHKRKIHIDFHYDSDNILDSNNICIESIILSTSSAFFKEKCKNNLQDAISFFAKNNVNTLLLKENRGGSTCYSFLMDKYYEAPAYNSIAMHSVGVGDAYNAIFISDFFEEEIEKRMKLAAICASKYAETMSFDKFICNFRIVLENANQMITMEGTKLSWDERNKYKIYIAGPDFPDVDTRFLDILSECLTYHNFTISLPIRENGLVKQSMTKNDEDIIYNKDIRLLDECDILIAVLLYNDPGTLVELGMFNKMNKPTIIFDPYNICTNMFVRHTPTYLCKNMEDVIDATFQCLKRR